MTNPTNGPAKAPGADSSKCSTSSASSGQQKCATTGVESANPPGSRSPGSLPMQADSKSESCCEGKSGSSHDESHSHDQPRSTKSDENRPNPVYAASPVAPHSAERSPSTSSRPDASSRPSSSPSGKHELTSPQDPKQFGVREPIQPKRSEPIQPSRVVEPTIGAASTAGDGDTE